MLFIHTMAYMAVYQSATITAPINEARQSSVTDANSQLTTKSTTSNYPTIRLYSVITVRRTGKIVIHAIAIKYPH